MLVKTKGIVIKQTKFSDSGIVVNMYTEEFGIQSYFVRGVRRKKSGKSSSSSKNKAAMFQPLTLLELVINYSDKKTMHNIKEIELWYAYQTINNNIIKRTLLFFIDELLYKCLKEESANQDLFNWIYNALVWLDLADEGYVNFHLVFMMQLSMFLGFYPKKDNSGSKIVFDLQEGKFINGIPGHPNHVSGKIATSLGKIQDTSFEDSRKLVIDNKTRKEVLETLIRYFELHIPALGEFKSLDVLKVVLE